MKIGYDFVLTFSITWAFSKIGLYFEHGHMIITWLFDKRIIDSDFEFEFFESHHMIITLRLSGALITGLSINDLMAEDSF